MSAASFEHNSSIIWECVRGGNAFTKKCPDTKVIFSKDPKSLTGLHNKRSVPDPNGLVYVKQMKKGTNIRLVTHHNHYSSRCLQSKMIQKMQKVIPKLKTAEGFPKFNEMYKGRRDLAKDAYLKVRKLSLIKRRNVTAA